MRKSRRRLATVAVTLVMVAAPSATGLLVDQADAVQCIAALRGIYKGQKGTWYICDNGTSFFIPD